MQNGDKGELFPGALPRLSAKPEGRTESEFGGGGKDTWGVRSPSEPQSVPPNFHAAQVLLSRRVTNRVAVAFYWLSRDSVPNPEGRRGLPILRTLADVERDA